MNDALLDWLGDTFVASGLINQGWTFVEYVSEYKLGYIEVK